jgi:hypothetical protein
VSINESIRCIASIQLGRILTEIDVLLSKGLKCDGYRPIMNFLKLIGISQVPMFMH